MDASGLDRVLGDLACPLCGSGLTRPGPALRCARGHGFDIARQGYVTLRSGAATVTGDTAAMVAAREAFLARGHYAPIARAVSRAVPRSTGGLCVDLAGGTGYYARAVLDEHPHLRGVCLDLSAPALQRAARAHERLAAVGADVWRALPLRDGVAACVLSVFGPRNPDEIARVLAPGGLLVVVTPTARHLAELVGPLGMIGVDPHKEARLDAQLGRFARAGRTAVEYEAAMSRGEVLDEVLMGPSAHHVTEPTVRAGVARMREPVRVTISVTLTVCAA